MDSELRVRGTMGLRVADASVMPTIVGGNTMAATVMVGEKAADFILDAWNDDGKMEDPSGPRDGDMPRRDQRIQDATSVNEEL